MNIHRIVRHLLTTHGKVRRAFPRDTMIAIERANKACEADHVGEVCFAIEGALHIVPLLRQQPLRDRAIEVFSQLRIWDTEHNNGVLIYVLLADRAVEIIADRGVHAKVGPPGMADHLPRHGKGVSPGRVSVLSQPSKLPVPVSRRPVSLRWSEKRTSELG